MVGIGELLVLLALTCSSHSHITTQALLSGFVERFNKFRDILCGNKELVNMRKRPDDQKKDSRCPKPKADQATSGKREFGGPKGLEPTRYGDWERKGRCVDF